MFNEHPEQASLRSSEKVYIRFKNCTDHAVGIIWINYFGEYTQYGLLKRDKYIDVTTYKTHPWFAVDMDTRDRMHVGDRFIFMPQTWQEVMKEKFPNHHVPKIDRRLLVKITLPLYSLKYRTLLAVRDLLTFPEDVDELEIPKQLKFMLKDSIEERNIFRSRNINQFL